MNKLVLGIVCAGLTVAAGTSAHAIMYTGSLTWSAGPASGLVASDGWADTSTVFSWRVQSDGTLDGYVVWRYTYTFTVPDKEISHVIIEVSPDFSANDVFNVNAPTGTKVEVGQFGPNGPGKANPNMPDTMQGIKFEKPGGDFGTSVTISFMTQRAPVWGDFYAKDGQEKVNQQSVWVTAWNAGFTSPDTDPDRRACKRLCAEPHLTAGHKSGGPGWRCNRCTSGPCCIGVGFCES